MNAYWGEMTSLVITFIFCVHQDDSLIPKLFLKYLISLILERRYNLKSKICNRVAIKEID